MNMNELNERRATMEKEAQAWFNNLSPDNLPSRYEISTYAGSFFSTQQVVEKLTNNKTFDWAIPWGFQKHCIDTYGVDPSDWETKVVWVYPEAMPFPVTRKAKEFLDLLP